MRNPASFEIFIAAKRSRLALLVFALGLFALPASFAASGVFHRSGEPVSWRPALDYFEWLASAVGLACCAVAPFLPKIPGSFSGRADCASACIWPAAARHGAATL